MSRQLETARLYRERAEEIRATALNAATNRDSLQTLAATYDRLAQSLEAIDKTNRALQGNQNRPPSFKAAIVLIHYDSAADTGKGL